MITFLTQKLFDYASNIWGGVSDFLSPLFFLPPLVLRVRITNRCNLACHFCYLGGSLNKKIDQVLGLDEWKKVIHSIPRFTLIDITGGEPFLTPNFKEIINLMLDRKLKISLITNGTVARPDMLENLVQKKLQYFMVSIDGDIALHDTIRGEGSYTKTIQTLKQVIALKKQYQSKYPMVVCKINLTDENYQTLVPLSHYLLEELKVDGLTFNLLFNNDARDGLADAEDFNSKKLWSGNTVKYKIESIDQIASSLATIREIYKQKISVRPEIAGDDVKGYLKNADKYSPGSCFKYRSIMTLYFDGRMTPCDLGLEVGNIRELDYNIRKIKMLAKLKSFFQLFEKNKRTIPGCAGCCLKTQKLLHEI